MQKTINKHDVHRAKRNPADDPIEGPGNPDSIEGNEEESNTNDPSETRTKPSA